MRTRYFIIDDLNAEGEDVTDLSWLGKPICALSDPFDFLKP